MIDGVSDSQSGVTSAICVGQETAPSGARSKRSPGKPILDVITVVLFSPELYVLSSCGVGNLLFFWSSG